MPVVKKSRITGSEAGKPQSPKPTVRALAEAGQAYASYVNGGTQAELEIELPAGRYKAEWFNPRTARVEKSQALTHAGTIRTVVRRHSLG